jgi:hypothetical protein
MNDLEMMELIGNQYDESIVDLLMYEDVCTGEIKDSGKAGSDRIYRTLKELEKELGFKL